MFYSFRGISFLFFYRAHPTCKDTMKIFVENTSIIFVSRASVETLTTANGTRATCPQNRFLSTVTISFKGEDRHRGMKKFAKSLMRLMFQAISQGSESMRYPLLERRIQKAFSTSPAYTVPLLLGLSPSHSPSLLLSL